MNAITLARPIAETASAVTPGPPPAGNTSYGPFGAQRGSGDKVTLSAVGRRVPEMVPCGGCGGEIRRNKTGLCWACWVASGGQRRNALSRVGKGESRKRDPGEGVAAAVRMLESAARRAIAEDPGTALEALLAAQRTIRVLVNDTGRALVESLGEHGYAAVAAELGWSRQRVRDRWGERA